MRESVSNLESSLDALGGAHGVRGGLSIHLVNVCQGQLSYQLQQQVQKFLLYCQVQLLLQYKMQLAWSG